MCILKMHIHPENIMYSTAAGIMEVDNLFVHLLSKQMLFIKLWLTKTNLTASAEVDTDWPVAESRRLLNLKAASLKTVAFYQKM